MKVNHIALSVKNLEESARFYINNFDFKEVNRFERKDLEGNAIILNLGSINLELWEFKDKIKNKDNLSNLNIIGIKHFAIEVNNINQVYKKLKDINVDIEIKQGVTGKYFFIKDPNDIPIEIYQPTKSETY